MRILSTVFFLSFLAGKLARFERGRRRNFSERIIYKPSVSKKANLNFQIASIIFQHTLTNTNALLIAVIKDNP